MSGHRYIVCCFPVGSDCYNSVSVYAGGVTGVLALLLSLVLQAAPPPGPALAQLPPQLRDRAVNETFMQFHSANIMPLLGPFPF